MAGIQQTLLYAAAMLLVGIGIPLFAALNGGLAARLHNPMLASTFALAAAMVVIVGALLLSGGLPRLGFDRSVPAWYYCGGLFVAAYILGMTWMAPKFGVGNAVAFVLLGQLISMTLIDHFGWFGATRFPLDGARLAGLLLMAAGVLLAVRR